MTFLGPDSVSGMGRLLTAASLVYLPFLPNSLFSFPASLLCLRPPRPHGGSLSPTHLTPLAWALCKLGASFLLGPILASPSRGPLLWEASWPRLCGHLCPQ